MVVSRRVLHSAAAIVSLWAGAARAQETAKPTLVIAISVDQFSANLFAEWRSRFTGGFARLAREGIVYPSAYQAHAMTETCPGHSTQLTGRHPSGTGIVGNEWYDAARGEKVVCTYDPSRRAAHDPEKVGDGPALLVATTLGDWMKAADPASRVVSVAGKARSAIMMGGHKTDATLWFDYKIGFTTGLGAGEQAEERLAPVKALNEKLRTPAPAWNYADDSCRGLEASYTIGAATWRSQLPPANWTGGLSDLSYSPLVDAYVLQLATELVDRYQLGRRGATDLLTVGLSGTDYVGHRYGSRGPEMCDQLRRLDAGLGAFLEAIEQRGIHPLVVLTADHGASDFPERLQANGYPDAGRVDVRAWVDTLNATLMQSLRLQDKPLLYTDQHQFYLVGAGGRGLQGKDRDRVMAAALPLIRAAPFVVQAFDAAVVLQAPRPARDLPPDEWTIEQRQRETVYTGRSGDLLLVYRPYQTVSTARPGDRMASHGAVWNYDRRVPWLVWGPGVPAQERFLPVDTTDIGPTLANAIGLAVPPGLDGHCRNVRAGAAPCAP